jgi:hypothetical protein
VPYNEFWYERGTLTNRTALIIDPPDGRIPALKPAADLTNTVTQWLGDSRGH